MIKSQILKAREHSKNVILGRKKKQIPENKKITFNIPYFQAFQNVRSKMEELHILF